MPPNEAPRRSASNGAANVDLSTELSTEIVDRTAPTERRSHHWRNPLAPDTLARLEESRMSLVARIDQIFKELQRQPFVNSKIGIGSLSIA